MKPVTTYWIKQFKQNTEYGHLGFKKLNKVFISGCIIKAFQNICPILFLTI